VDAEKKRITPKLGDSLYKHRGIKQRHASISCIINWIPAFAGMTRTHTRIWREAMENSTSIIGKRLASFDEIKAQVNHIVDKFHPQKIILFGSYAIGNPDPESDVDFLIIIETLKSTWKLHSEIALALDHSFPIDIVVKTPSQIDERVNNGDFFLKNILDHGKVIYERTH
jgi:uncharacterized protein